MPHLLDLPNEILLLISSHLSPRSFNALLRTNQQLHTLLAPTLSQYILHGIQDAQWSSEGNSEPYQKLYWACFRGHPKPLRMLLETGRLNVNARTRRYSSIGFIQKSRQHSVTALHMAAVSGNEGVARLLLDYGADVDARETVSGKTALLLAAESANEKVARLLIARGADIEARTDRGTVLDRVIMAGMLDLAGMLMKMGVKSPYMETYRYRVEEIGEARAGARAKTEGALYSVGMGLALALGTLVRVGRG